MPELCSVPSLAAHCCQIWLIGTRGTYLRLRRLQRALGCPALLLQALLLFVEPIPLAEREGRERKLNGVRRMTIRTLARRITTDDDDVMMVIG